MLWIRFAASQLAGPPWFLEIPYSGLDRAVLYHRNRQGAWVVQEAGDSKPVPQWPLPGRFPTFALEAASDAPVTYWLSIEHARVPFSSAIQLKDDATLATTRDREQFLLGAYFGLVALVTLIALASALTWRDRNFAAYGIYVLALGVGQLANLGTGAQYVWPHWLEWNRVATFLLPALSSAAALWFVRVITEPARFSRGFDHFVQALIAVQAVVAVVDAWLVQPQTYAVIPFLVFVTLLVVTVTIALVWQRGEDAHIRVVALGFLPVVVFALFPIARALGWIPSGFFTRYGIAIGAALEMPILLYAMNLRSSARREASARERALATTDALTGLAHRRVLMLRLEAALSRAETHGHQCAMLAVRLVNHGAIAATHAPETAERALVIAAARLRGVVSDVDVAARVGENEFALLLDGPATRHQALACATHVVARGLRDSLVLPAGVTLQFQVAAAMLPEGGFNAADSLRWLLAGAGPSPDEPARTIRTLNF